MTTSEPDIEQLARRFPLVPRPRPALLPLPQQLAEIADLARTPRDHPDADSRIAAAHNKAALVASNCGHPDLAQALCWEHHHRYTNRQPWTAREARLALEPLVNLARLHIRADRTDAAVETLESLLTAASHGGTAHIDGHPIDLGPTIATHEDRNTIRRWLWTVTLADGIRALTRTGRFDDALTHAERHHGIGATLLDGRQVAVLAHAERGDHAAATAMLTTTEFAEPWQEAVAHLLGMLIRRIANPGRSECSRPLLGSRLVAALSEMDEVFGWEIKLAIAELADDHDRSFVFSQLSSCARAMRSAAIARTVLGHPAGRRIPMDILDHLALLDGLATSLASTSRLTIALEPCCPRLTAVPRRSQL